MGNTLGEARQVTPLLLPQGQGVFFLVSWGDPQPSPTPILARLLVPQPLTPTQPGAGPAASQGPFCSSNRGVYILCYPDTVTTSPSLSPEQRKPLEDLQQNINPGTRGPRTEETKTPCANVADFHKPFEKCPLLTVTVRVSGLLQGPPHCPQCGLL